MNDRGKSDSRVVPAKLANKTRQPVEEPVEERRLVGLDQAVPKSRP
jgi:hypothetical protein